MKKILLASGLVLSTALLVSALHLPPGVGAETPLVSRPNGPGEQVPTQPQPAPPLALPGYVNVSNKPNTVGGTPPSAVPPTQTTPSLESTPTTGGCR